MTQRAHTIRGLTLLELLIASALALVAVGAASVAFVSMTKSLQSSELSRGATSGSRDAMLPVETSLRDLGWGIDPRYAIDMTSAVRCRDSYNAPDELSFVARNPLYRWLDRGEGACVTLGGCFSGNAWHAEAVNLAATPKTISVTLAAGVVLEQGRIVQVVCAGGQSPVMLTLSQRYVGAGALVALLPNPVNSVPYNDFNSLLACHGDTGSGLFLVDRYHYFVSTLNGVPWLMLDPGIDQNGDGALPPADGADLVPLAKNVEDLQVAYVLTPDPAFVAPDSNLDWIVGNNKAASAVEELDPAAAGPTYGTASDSATRFNKHPANVRAIRLIALFRSDRSDPNHAPSWAGDSVSAAENRVGTLSGGRYLRSVSSSAITLRNMDSRSPFTF